MIFINDNQIPHIVIHIDHDTNEETVIYKGQSKSHADRHVKGLFRKYPDYDAGCLVIRAAL